MVFLFSYPLSVILGLGYPTSFTRTIGSECGPKSVSGPLHHCLTSDETLLTLPAAPHPGRQY